MLYVVLRGILLTAALQPVHSSVGKQQFNVFVTPVIVTSILK